MVACAKVRLKRKGDNFEMQINASEYAADVAKWKDWTLVGETHVEGDTINATVEDVNVSPEGNAPNAPNPAENPPENEKKKK